MNNYGSKIIANIFFFCAAMYFLISFKIYFEPIAPPPVDGSSLELHLYYSSLYYSSREYTLGLVIFFLVLGLSSLLVGLYSWYSRKKQWQQTNKIFP